ncbi:MAG: hypothetical protein FK733_12675 [Asgard group archaeon]|nr:hypothetical protein [Asgard group archaeon]
MIKNTVQKITLLISASLNSLFVILLSLSITFYSGGSRFHDDYVGYTLLENFISDLGRTIALNDQVNTVSMVLFMVAIMCFSLAQGLLLFNVPFILNNKKIVLAFAIIALIIGIVYIGCYIGIAFNPHDIRAKIHNKLIYTAAPLVFVSSVFLTIAMFLSKTVDRFYSYVMLSLLIVFALFAIATGIGTSLEREINWNIRMIGHTILIYSESVIFITYTFGLWNHVRKSSETPILDIEDSIAKT